MAVQEGAGAITLYEVASGQELRRLQEVANRLGVWGLVSFSPDGQWLTRGDIDGAIRFWDTETGQLQATFHGYKAMTTALAFSPDGKILATSSTDQTTKLWDLHVILSH